MVTKIKYCIALFIAPLLFASCGGSGNKNALTTAEQPAETAVAASADPMADWKNNKGIGPVTSLELRPLDQKMAEEGKAIYEAKCTACHKPDKKFIGPAPKGILERRTPEWIMNMILNPETMIKEDPIAKQLLMEANGAPMANQHLTQEEARKVLEYFRTL